ncbi:MAG: class I SAM-dependent methyltransferase [Hyphomonas sp.]|nr:class I SAM-dependent methyltransferase [Hyphomonas sp.]
MKTAAPAALLALALLAGCAKTAPAATDQAAPAAETAEPAVVDALQAALDSDVRSEAEKARDAWRHPKETLEFFGVEAGDTVLETWPGGGWYTNILAPWLASGGGTLIAAVFDPDAAADEERRARTETRNAEFMANYADPKFGTIAWSEFSSVSGPLAEPGSVDVVLTFRNVHNWMGGGYEQKFFADAYAALKPGGVLGVVEHRLPSTGTQDPAAGTGYVHEDYVKTLATNAGFEFAGASEINANPSDTADHPYGVWTLPPVSRSPGEDETAPEGWDPEKYAAIGESDRMTLKFVKPAE